MSGSLYLPLYSVAEDSGTWVYVSVSLPRDKDVLDYRFIEWCSLNTTDSWTMVSFNKFGFKNSHDALVFKFQFG